MHAPHQDVTRTVAPRSTGAASGRRRIAIAGLRRGNHEGPIRAHARARRWRRIGSQTVAVATGQLAADARFWAAVFEAGPRAQLDGESALIASGLTGYRSDSIRVSVPRGAKVRRARGLDIRQTRRWDADDLDSRGVPRTRIPVAAVRSALWAKTDRQAALLLTMSVQQGLTTAQDLGVEALRIKRDRRRRLVHDVILDLAGGVRSLGELDFARECRRRGLPEPSRQVVRRGRDGRHYLDVAWEQWRVAVEIDGVHHSWAVHVVSDALRQNAIVLQDMLVLRLPLLGFRVEPDAFFAQIEEALASRGCPILGRSA
jgi:very-short-patch-repair endonuclease